MALGASWSGAADPIQGACCGPFTTWKVIGRGACSGSDDPVRQTDRVQEKQRHRETERSRDRQTNRDRERKYRETEIERSRDRPREKKIQRQRQNQSETERPRQRPRKRKRERQRDRDRNRDTCVSQAAIPPSARPGCSLAPGAQRALLPSRAVSAKPCAEHHLLGATVPLTPAARTEEAADGSR